MNYKKLKELLLKNELEDFDTKSNFNKLESEFNSSEHIKILYHQLLQRQ